MLIVTSNKIPGHRIDAVFGEVMGLTVRSRDIGAQVMAGFRSLGGGELPEMTKALYESRQEVMARMVNEAQQRGANAIVAMRFDTSEMGGNWTEVCAYGTAVFAIPLAEGEPGATGQSIYLTSAAARQSTQPTTPAAPQGQTAPPAPGQFPASPSPQEPFHQ
ncbi:YbjQ family protein [Arthrobacter bambusae]|uniref:YbjQ family protein n=1 Tax=unclassified Arthrobacter TaxID=235627 RepID=UPI00254FFD85|nr:YbjQ family protein [Arthrobacter sp. efr-133-R2A-120]